MSVPRISVIRTDADFRALAGEWEELHASVGGTVFQSFPWLWNWWQIYSRSRTRLHILTTRLDGRLTAILPLYIEHIGYRLIGLDRLRMIGVYETYGEYALLAERKHLRDSTRVMAEYLAGMIKGPACDMVSFFRFDPSDEVMQTLLHQMRSHGLIERFVPRVIPRVMMDLPADHDTWFASLSSNERDLLKRKGKALEKKGAVVEVVSAADPGAFRDYVRLHSATWTTRGVSGYFASERMRRFLEIVTEELMGRGQARLYFLAKDGVRFTAVHAFFVNGQCCFYLSGLDRAHELSNLSPGRVLLARVIRDAIAEGIKVFDFQGGDEEYKHRLGGRRFWFAKAIFLPRDHQGIKVILFLWGQGAYQALRWRMRERILPAIRSLVPRGAGRSEPSA